MYDVCQSQQQAPPSQTDTSLFLSQPDLAVTIYASSQPTSYVYQQANTVTYRQIYQSSDNLSSYCTPASSTPQASAVFFQDQVAGQISSMPPPTHYMIPPPPSAASSSGPQTFSVTPQFSFAQSVASAPLQMQPPPLYQQSSAYSGYSAAGIQPPPADGSYSLFSAIQPPPPPSLPSNSNTVSYWMSLS